MEKLSSIECDLVAYKITLQFLGKKGPLVVHFDTPSRRFYFSIIALIINEMKKDGQSKFIHIRKFKKILQLLDKAISGKHASKNIEGLWAKINMAWRHRLPDLETAVLFKVLDRDLVQPYEKGGKYRYECSETECDVWANLFSYDENNKWRFKFATESTQMGMNNIQLSYGELQDNFAWNEYLKRLSIEPKTGKKENKAVPIGGNRVMFPVAVISIILIAISAIWYFSTPHPQQRTILELPDKPSIAVLPFKNLSGDPKQEYFTDGVVEGIITTLSRVPKLFVIARISTFTYKDKPVKVQQISEELGVRYVLEGSVRKDGENIRIAAQLIDAVKGHHLWVERYDRNLNLKDIFGLQDEIAMKVLTALEVKLVGGQASLFISKGTNNLDAYLKVIQGREFHERQDKENNFLARKKIEEALALDPNYAAAYNLLARTYFMDVWLGSVKSPRVSLMKAIDLTKKAISLDDSLADSHALLGYLYTLTRQHEQAITQGERALQLDPNSSTAYLWLGASYQYAGRKKEAVGMVKKAMRLNPMPPSSWFVFYGAALFNAGQYDEAMTAAKKAIALSPNNIFANLLAVLLHSLAERNEKARQSAAEVLRIQPDFSLNKFAKRLPYKDPANVDRMVKIWRRAGLPE